MVNKYVSDPIPFDLEALECRPKRIDLEFKRIEHQGASYEARVFLNHKRAGLSTSLDHPGYAGSFFIFGHGGCFGDVGHCELNHSSNPYDRRSTHALTPAFKRINATESILRACENKKELTVTVVPIITAATDRCDLENVLKFEKLTLITYG